MRVLLISEASNLPKLFSAISGLNPNYVEAITNGEAKVGVDKLLIANLNANECWVNLAVERAEGFDLIALPSSRDMREVASRLSVRIGVPYVAGAVQLSLKDGLLATKLCFGGRGLEVLSSQLPVRSERGSQWFRAIFR